MEDFNTIRHGDCIASMEAMPPGFVDLVFADPPFNIGYEYDVYDDKLDADQYVAWCRRWISSVSRILKPDGTFWLAIGDEYAAELKLLSQELGFSCRSWVIWYYTFGVNCSKKFTRSHAHLFHFVRDAKQFTFRDDDLENRIPSARELVYNDKRANPKGRLPDDTWIIRPADARGELSPDDEAWIEQPSDNDRTFTLRPQDLEECFRGEEDTWYFPRVAGTFKERAGFHGCQMPEQLLGRIIRVCTHPDDLVLDPFSGSGTTVAVAKKLGRRFLAFDLSEDYVALGKERLAGIHVGDALDGSAEPTKSAPRTGHRGKQTNSRSGEAVSHTTHTRNAIFTAYAHTHEGYSADRLIADLGMNARFVHECERRGAIGDTRLFNRLLLRMRKSGDLSAIPTTRRTNISWADCDPYLFASEIALQTLLDDGAGSLDEILCDPNLALEFDRVAGSFAPEFDSLKYRWGALRLRKVAKIARQRAQNLPIDFLAFSQRCRLEEFKARSSPQEAGVYRFLDEAGRPIYVGETLSLRERLVVQIGSKKQRTRYGEDVSIETCPLNTRDFGHLSWQSLLISRKERPRLNYAELQAS